MQTARREPQTASASRKCKPRAATQAVNARRERNNKKQTGPFEKTQKGRFYFSRLFIPEFFGVLWRRLLAGIYSG